MGPFRIPFPLNTTAEILPMGQKGVFLFSTYRRFSIYGGREKSMNLKETYLEIREINGVFRTCRALSTAFFFFFCLV